MSPLYSSQKVWVVDGKRAVIEHMLGRTPSSVQVTRTVGRTPSSVQVTRTVPTSVGMDRFARPGELLAVVVTMDATRVELLGQRQRRPPVTGWRGDVIYLPPEPEPGAGDLFLVVCTVIE